VEEVDIIIECEPPWEPDMMSDAARQQLEKGER
jgi:metal-sulfur cluster biosynthetic enzyme